MHENALNARVFGSDIKWLIHKRQIALYLESAVVNALRSDVSIWKLAANELTTTRRTCSDNSRQRGGERAALTVPDVGDEHGQAPHSVALRHGRHGARCPEQSEEDWVKVGQPPGGEPNKTVSPAPACVRARARACPHETGTSRTRAASHSRLSSSFPDSSSSGRRNKRNRNFPVTCRVKGETTHLCEAQMSLCH